MSKVCIVTGASQGMGRGIAKVLGEEESAIVYATARSEQALNELASSVKGNGTIHPFVLDQNDHQNHKLVGLFYFHLKTQLNYLIFP